MLSPLLTGSLYIVLIHILVWFSSNGQFIKNNSFFSNHALLFAMAAGPIIGFLGYHGSRMIYHALEGSVWQIRFIGFGLSYLVFPVLTWFMLGETMFTAKTMICIFLSLIIFIQVYFQRFGKIIIPDYYSYQNYVCAVI